eukprot:CAMPEP_0197653568 /NCGR_PEP_ID=MMETSP1338-20131121/36124_1 /TAXON_ID=43686 ORGANISM="Pelagodinium beii, Strain RCC1491" /NCGR_SAMPLE_ID=MMETSP1338 /ASSEMBLY_ACC=CAM_ASM_000754 /LENGTH=118 /DNA_ID=CAMNT_0043228725 /DNA_START=56 /DNA_END=412 /DNA_ORIENTATION=+
MDAVRTANLRAYVDSTPKTGSSESFPASWEKKQLAEERRKRSMMTLMERMDADAEHKQALSQVKDMRQNQENRKALDKMVERMRPTPDLKEPKVVNHDSKALTNDHSRKQNWAPLECY